MKKYPQAIGRNPLRSRSRPRSTPGTFSRELAMSSPTDEILQEAGKVLKKIISALDCESSDLNDIRQLNVGQSLHFGTLPPTHI